MNAPHSTLESLRDEAGRMAVLLGGVDAMVLCVTFQAPPSAPVVDVVGPVLCRSLMSEGGSSYFT
jgi:hypothetical protein